MVPYEKVKIYFSEYCPYCKSVEALMNKKILVLKKSMSIQTQVCEKKW